MHRKSYIVVKIHIPLTLIQLPSFDSKLYVLGDCMVKIYYNNTYLQLIKSGVLGRKYVCSYVTSKL